jgi:hypothetical protein
MYPSVRAQARETTMLLVDTFSLVHVCSCIDNLLARSVEWCVVGNVVLTLPKLARRLYMVITKIAKLSNHSSR